MAESLKQRTARSLAWSGLASVATQVLNLAFGIVLARRLTPGDYGMVGVLTVFNAVAVALQESGFIAALTNLKTARREDYSSVFWFSTFVGLTLYAALFACAPLLADFFGKPELTALSRLVFVSFVVAGVGTPFSAYMFRELMNKEKAVLGVAALLCSGAVGVTLAYSGYSYWSLAWQQLTYVSVFFLGRFFYVPWLPMARIDLRPVRRMFGFGSKMLVTSVVNAVSGNILSLVFGKMFAGQMHLVGHFTQANKWNTMATSVVRDTLSPVAQPVLAIIRDDNAGRLRAFRKLLRFTSLLTFPAMFGLAGVAEEFILVTIGPQWLPCVPLLRWLCVGGAFVPLQFLFQQMAVAAGRSGLFMRMNVSLIAVQIGSVLATAHWGMETMVAVYATLNAVWFFLWHFAGRRLIGLRLADLLRDVAPFLLLAAALVAGVCYATVGVASLWLRLGLRVTAVCALYFGTLRLLGAQIVNELWKFIRKG
ncbi:MAG: lipopolysaccharide biosynthesis protein [Bacteroidaceae bacterium]|nr:lipopolysaccharide biosynthesis protein [Bacteroidaceae bacterium]